MSHFSRQCHQSQCNDSYRVSRNQTQQPKRLLEMVTCVQPLKWQNVRYNDKGARNRKYTAPDRVYSAENPTSLSGISETGLICVQL
jgi:hypothetical protein